MKMLVSLEAETFVLYSLMAHGALGFDAFSLGGPGGSWQSWQRLQPCAQHREQWFIASAANIAASCHIYSKVNN